MVSLFEELKNFFISVPVENLFPFENLCKYTLSLAVRLKKMFHSLLLGFHETFLIEDVTKGIDVSFSNLNI